MKAKKYAIIDIETTGGMYNKDKITEIAVIVTDGYSILAQYQSLVDPERSIPTQITRLTGIDNTTVIGAPKFYEIAKNIIEITEGCIFVAHNVKFDYNFIKEEFRSLGYSYNKKQLCTVKLTRSMIPGLESYSLDNLIRHFNLDVADRHRAFDDAYATTEIFMSLFGQMQDDYHLQHLINGGLDASILPRGLDIEQVHSAPEAPGIYYFLNEYKQVFYVGKALNIKSRIFQHFRELSRKSTNIYSRLSQIKFFETGSELLALLLELHEIKALRPDLNKAMRNNTFQYALYYHPSAPYDKPRFDINRNSPKLEHRFKKVRLFSSKQSAIHFVQQLIESNQLCSRLFKVPTESLICPCQGQCSQFFQHTRDEDVNILSLIQNDFDEDMIILTDGRSTGEQGFVMIRNNRFHGFGYVQHDTAINSPEEWNDYLSYTFFYPEAYSIIKNYLEKNKCKTIRL